MAITTVVVWQVEGFNFPRPNQSDIDAQVEFYSNKGTMTSVENINIDGTDQVVRTWTDLTDAETFVAWILENTVDNTNGLISASLNQ